MRARWLLALPVMAVGVFVLFSASVSFAEEAGDLICAECHEEVAEAFWISAHGRAEYSDAQEVCESCHGPSADHIDEGDPALILAFGNATPEEASDACLSCHNEPAVAYWGGSTHQTAESSCTTCHSVHQPWTADRALVNKNSTAGCLECHGSMRKTMFQRSNHPLKTGQMSCSSCHNPHGSAVEPAIDAISVNDKCWECHAETRGPFLWEHAPVRENCLTCHDPHASNQAKMLTVAAPRLCQSCHLFGHHQTVPGEPSQVWNLNRSCVNCHPRIHGSNHPSGVIFMR